MSCGYDDSIAQALEGKFRINQDGTYVSFEFIQPPLYMCDEFITPYERIWHWHPIALAPATQYDWAQRRSQSYPGYVWCEFIPPA